MVKLVSDYIDCHADAISLLGSEGACFLSRIGGSDTNAIVDYLRVLRTDPDGLPKHIDEFLPIVARFNGFYDQAKPRESYIRYCNLLIECYGRSQSLTMCNFQLLSLFFRDTLHPNFYSEAFPNRDHYRMLIDEIDRTTTGLTAYPYQFIEKLVFDDNTLFRAFSVVLRDKKVIVISPFSESIEYNFKNRHKFFSKGYDYPEFELRTIDTPITYAGLPGELYPHSDWFETVAALKASIRKADFDVALMSCGSYAMPLGIFIEQELKRKAVYVGGVLQLFFGIMGRRYDNPFFLDQINRQAFIYPLERDRYLKHFAITDETAREAFGAYF